MKQHLLFLLTFAFAFTSIAQKQICIAFYNQENLFDTIDDPNKNDNEYLPSAKREWNTEKYTNKINHMAKVIRLLNHNQAPDVLGMCEVENKAVLMDLVLDKQLKSSRYNIVHYESPDERSIDNALIYKSKQFRFISSAAYPVTFPDNPASKTRDILLVKLEAKNKTRIIFLVNHFPSRLGGQQESEAKRFRAASILRQICDSINKVDPNQPIVVMGDFNDEPNNRSIDSVFGAKGNPAEVNASSVFFNAMYAYKSKGEGSYLYRKEWNMLDQFMVNKVLLDCTTNVCYKPESATIVKEPWMVETDEKYKGGPLHTFGGMKYINGYSDHFPVFILLTLKK